jgi:type VI secretion system protein ImpE
MTPVQTAEQALREGNTDAALKSLQDGVRAQPANAKLRVFLFQLLCVTGQWPRALNQLEVCGELDAATIPMVTTYREALKCESLREAVFAGKTTPMVFGKPQAWVALLIEALRCDARGDSASAARLRDDAFEAAPATPGRLDGAPFEWIADADSRLGPVLEAMVNGRYYWIPFNRLARVAIEAPTDLRDMVWLVAQLQFANGGEVIAMLPTRYPGSETSDDDQILMARKTDWREDGPERWLGLGQRVLVTDQGERDLLSVRTIELVPGDG